MPESNPYSSYRETQILTASPGKLVVLLYEGAVRNLDNAAAALDRKNIEEVNHLLLKTQDIVTELALSVNFEAGELASKMYNLYMYFNKTLLEANIRKDRQLIVVVRGMLADLLDAWRAVAEKPGVKPMAAGGINLAG